MSPDFSQVHNNFKGEIINIFDEAALLCYNLSVICGSVPDRTVLHITRPPQCAVCADGPTRRADNGRLRRVSDLTRQ